MEAKEMSFGKKLVGVSFNPSADSDVDSIKGAFADLADFAMAVKQPEGGDGYLFNTIKGECIRTILDAQMWLVKIVTLKY